MTLSNTSIVHLTAATAALAVVTPYLNYECSLLDYKNNTCSSLSYLKAVSMLIIVYTFTMFGTAIYLEGSKRGAKQRERGAKQRAIGRSSKKTRR